MSIETVIAEGKKEASWQVFREIEESEGLVFSHTLEGELLWYTMEWAYEWGFRKGFGYSFEYYADGSDAFLQLLYHSTNEAMMYQARQMMYDAGIEDGKKLREAQ